jgi:hypothetical protein
MEAIMKRKRRSGRDLEPIKKQINNGRIDEDRGGNHEMNRQADDHCSPPLPEMGRTTR